MAMLCALVAAMFLSIVPVKAEAAHTHVDKDKDYVCDFKNCSEHVHQLVKIDEVKATCNEGGRVAHYYCDGCKNMYEDEAATKQIQNGDQWTEKTGHDMQWEITETTHKRTCANECGYVEKQSNGDYVENHKFTYKVNDDGTHTATCKVCGYEKTEDHAEGKTKDCKCYLCDAELEHTTGEWKLYPSDNSKHFKQCTVCYKTLETAEHKYTYEYTNANYHVATCEDCGHKAEKQLHVDENGDCKCDLCGGDTAHTDHSFMTFVEAKAATCEEDGNYSYWKCNKCGGSFLNNGNAFDPTIPATGHIWNTSCVWNAEEHWLNCLNEGCEERQEVDAHKFVYVDCEDGETHLKTCEVCKTTPDAAEPHEDSNGDCKCDKCGAQMAHSPVMVAEKEPTCTEEGVKEHAECQYCGALFLNGTEVDKEALIIPATGHNWSYKQILNDKHLAYCPTCKTYELLDHEDTDGDCLCDIKGCTALVHSHQMVIHAEVPATCEEDGTEAYYTYLGCGKMFDLNQNAIEEPKVIKATGHDLSDKWVPGENGQHVRKCANCDYCETEDHVFKNGDVHCTVCGAEEDLTYVAAKDATCTEQGNVEYWTSKVTGKKYADEAGTQELENVIVPATGHELTGLVDNGNGTHSQHCQNPGCAYEEGSGIHKAAENGCYCADCGGAMDGHELTLVKAVAATCEKAGTEAYFQCSCGAKYDLEGQSIQAPKAIAKLAHTTDGKVYRDTKEGKHYTECTTCGKKFYEEHVMAVQDPMKGNYHQYVCECGELEVEQHYDEDGDGFCDVCDHSMSSASVTVEQHDSVTVTTGDASTINKHYTWWRNWLEALFPSNSGGTVASAQKTEETSAASAQSAAPAANSASQNAGQNATASSGTTAGETVVNTNALTQFISWFLGLFGF